MLLGLFYWIKLYYDILLGKGCQKASSSVTIRKIDTTICIKKGSKRSHSCFLAFLLVCIQSNGMVERVFKGKGFRRLPLGSYIFYKNVC